MNAPDPNDLDALRGGVEQAWHRFLDLYEGLRPELYRYCRHLTRSPFEADDLVQDSMFRGFVTLGCMAEPPPRPRAWLFRVASNLWIDRLRARHAAPDAAPEAPPAGEPRELREAAGTLIARLSPHERAAVVLKEAFGFSLEEIAEALSTTPGTVKSALHRGRGKLAEPPAEEPAPPRPQVLDAFCAAFNAGDVERLTALLLDTAEIEVVRVHTEYGPEAARRGVFQGMMFGPRLLADPSRLPPGIDPEHVVGIRPEVPRCEARTYRGEWLLVLWYAHADGEAVRALNRVTVEGDRLARVRNYFYTPDVLAEVCRELNVPFRSNGHRFWKPTER
jgi:RNA polymerase sigma-70 factor (ECF subfamily)